MPVVYDASGADLVMERLDGRDMLADLGRRPWLVRGHARTLAGLHNQLHAIPAPAGLSPSFWLGGKVLHPGLPSRERDADQRRSGGHRLD